MSAFKTPKGFEKWKPEKMKLVPNNEPGNTVATATVRPNVQQALYLWEEGNVPATTVYTVNDREFFDDPDFRPYIASFPVPEGVPVKGAVVVCAGGAFLFRSDQMEGTPIAQALSELGFQSFVLNYRLNPYTQEEGALDLARAVRFIRAHASEYGIAPHAIAVMGFSAGGILAGEMLLNWKGQINGSALDLNYQPDELDQVSADAAADGMIYSFYGRLSVASTDGAVLKEGNLPPTYYCYGTEDPFYSQFNAQVQLMKDIGYPVECVVLQNMPHGFGPRGDWIPAYADWLERVFSK